ncbi:hypothetical protein R3P38DRAFT_2781627 [Favolaschia claudopus]|uniref:Uncharacterized protein n=1 Tax=Favolaschia claudopus TaxID=2862362 RepID=A0AAW0B7W5_9AGAR
MQYQAASLESPEAMRKRSLIVTRARESPQAKSEPEQSQRSASPHGREIADKRQNIVKCYGCDNVTLSLADRSVNPVGFSDHTTGCPKGEKNAKRRKKKEKEREKKETSELSGRAWGGSWEAQKDSRRAIIVLV